ncbi:MAG TPA: hypothetical protein VMS94_02340 [Acidobacteriota bacterium]|nr:hypothetical protein [Acidobacteriota bacterium]
MSIFQDYILLDKAFAAWNASIVILAIIGVALYMYGYLRREATYETISEVITLSIVLITWGVFTYFIGPLILGIYTFPDTLWETRALTTWDYISYWMWELKAILGIGIGLLLIPTLLLKRHATNKNDGKGKTI